MFERIRQHVDSHLVSRGEPGMNPSKVIFLDDSEGLTEGALQLIFGETSEFPLLIAKGAPENRARRRGGRPIYEVEYANLQALEGCGMNTSARTTPEPLGLWRDNGFLVTLQAALPGELLKNIPGPELFSEPALEASLDGVLGWWERFQQGFGVRRRNVDEAFYRERVTEQLDAFQRRFEIAADERAFLDRRLRDERTLQGLDLPLFVRHGDLCTANMVRLPGGIGVFDWEFHLQHELPLFDVFHFFASMRYPFRGPRRESSHFDSFVAVYWEENRVRREVFRRLAGLCDRHDVPVSALGDLFLISLIQIANLKYDGFVEIHGPSLAISHPDRPGDPAELPWREIGGQDKNAPFARIKEGAVENIRYVARKGLPDFGSS